MARRTLQNYIDLMSHGLGKTPDVRHQLVQTFNDAGRALFTCCEGAPFQHSWGWILRDNVPFTIPGNQVQEVQLPDDFGTFVSLEYQRSFVGRVVTTTPGELNRVRRIFNVDPLRIYICFDVGEKQLNAQQGPRKVAAFWPPRDDDQTGLMLTYRRTWVDAEVNPQTLNLVDPNAVPDIPQEYERLLVLLARAFAVHIEDQAEAFESQAIQQEVARLVDWDAGKQINKGPPMHSVMARATRIGSFPAWYGRPITGPFTHHSTLT